MKRRLIVSDGQRERELLLVGTIVVGRDPACDISEDGDSLLSRRHTEFVAGPESVVVRDLGSRNGTFVNGVRIAEGAIRAGDVVHIGHLRVRYVEDDTPLAAQLPAPVPIAAAAVEDEEVTRIVHSRPQPAPKVQPAPASSAPPDDERTVVTPRPGPSPVRAAQPSQVSIDDERTVFVPSASAGRTPAPAESRPAPAAPVKPMTPAPERPRVPPPARPSVGDLREPALGALRAFVWVQVGAVAAVVFLAVVLAVALGHSELFGAGAGAAALVKWLGPPAGVALLMAYRTGRMINRRVARILTADNGEGRRL